MGSGAQATHTGHTTLQLPEKAAHVGVLGRGHRRQGGAASTSTGMMSTMGTGSNRVQRWYTCVSGDYGCGCEGCACRHTCPWVCPAGYLWGVHTAPLRSAALPPCVYPAHIPSPLGTPGQRGSELILPSTRQALGMVPAPYSDSNPALPRGAPPPKTGVMSPFLAFSAVIARCHGHGWWQGGQEGGQGPWALPSGWYTAQFFQALDSETHTHTPQSPPKASATDQRAPSNSPELPTHPASP